MMRMLVKQALRELKLRYWKGYGYAKSQTLLVGFEQLGWLPNGSLSVRAASQLRLQIQMQDT
jgi:hypothetical protein